MRVTNKLTAIYMSFIITFASFSPIHSQKIVNNADSYNLEASILTESLEPLGRKIDETITYEIEAIDIVEDAIEAEETIDEIEAEETVDEPIISVSNEDIELLALVTMAEAEGESEEGKRMVIDTILNRVDSERFDNTISEVIYAPNQFTSMRNGRVDRCYVADDIYQLVIEELTNRTNYDVLYFTAYQYGAYGTPMFQIGNHYFSK